MSKLALVLSIVSAAAIACALGVAIADGAWVRSNAASPGARNDSDCRIRLRPGAESHAVEFATRCNFEQRRLVIRPSHQVFGLDHSPTISHPDSRDHFRCHRSSGPAPIVCRGRAGEGVRVSGLFETSAFSCDVATHIRVLGSTGRPEVRRFVRKPRGCAPGRRHS